MMSNQKQATWVLVVDDDQEVREVMRLALEDEGYHALQASDGTTALQILRASEQRMVVLLDQLMPGIDGIKALQTIKQDPALTKHAYILMTASSQTPSEAFSLLSDLSAELLRKPFELDTLFDHIERAAERLQANDGS
jgi:CheY-like chemotaxis protein